MIYLTYDIAKTLLKNIDKDNVILKVSFDLGKTFEKVYIRGRRIVLKNGIEIDMELLKKIKRDRIYIYKDNTLYEISIRNKNYYKLVPTADYPTLEINGIRMHRTKECTPKNDTIMKLSKIKIFGFVLDTCFGLGYTAIHASKRARFVMSCEVDENVIKIAKLNPYSREAFINKKIQIVRGDICFVIKGLRDCSVNVVIHDPPRFSLAGQLYSEEFYKEIFRVLKNGGYLFHYIGEPGKRRGLNIKKGVINRLRNVGFKNVRWHEDVKGITARKI